MYYEHLGGDQYEIHLVIYRDCGPTNTNGTGFDLAANMAAYQGTQLFSQVQSPITSDVQQIDLQAGNPCAQLPPGVCVERAVYTQCSPCLPALNRTSLSTKGVAGIHKSSTCWTPPIQASRFSSQFHQYWAMKTSTSRSTPLQDSMNYRKAMSVSISHFR